MACRESQGHGSDFEARRPEGKAEAKVEVEVEVEVQAKAKVEVKVKRRSRTASQLQSASIKPAQAQAQAHPDGFRTFDRWTIDPSVPLPPPFDIPARWVVDPLARKWRGCGNGV
jgi:hypothetical protein